MRPSEVRLDGTHLLVDAATAEAQAGGPPGEAPLPPDLLEALGAARGGRRVVVIGDGGDPDSGARLARELAALGVTDVWFVEGGAPALRQRLEAR